MHSTSQRRDSLAAMYQSLWKPGKPVPNLADVLAQYPEAEIDERFAVMLVDQQLRWRIGIPVPAETYIEGWPELTSVPSRRMQLITAELQIRAHRGESISREEIARRFPALSQTLTQRLPDLIKPASRPAPQGPVTVDSASSDSIPVRGVETRVSGRPSPPLPPPPEQAVPSGAASAPLGAEMSQMLGQVLGSRYVLLRRLGAGGFGQVFLGQDQRFAGQDGAGKVAVKIMGQGAEFRKEALLMRQFRHPNVAEVYDYGIEPSGIAWMVMEYLPGETMEEWVDQFPDRIVPLEKLADFVEQIGDALEVAHSRNLVHHDLKPANIMVVRPGTPSEQFKLLDFGLAAKLDGQNSLANNTRRRAFTPYYVAPETIVDEQLTAQSDIYTFGVILYELLTGHVPWPRTGNLYAQLEQVGNKRPRPFAKVAPQSKFPRGLEALVMKCLHKSPRSRPQSLRQVCDDFLAIVRHRQPPGTARRGSSATIAVVVTAVVLAVAADRWLMHAQFPALPAWPWSKSSANVPAKRASPVAKDASNAMKPPRSTKGQAKQMKSEKTSGTTPTAIEGDWSETFAPPKSRADKSVAELPAAKGNKPAERARTFPGLLKAPFTADEALAARRAWAESLGKDESFRNSLGMEFVLVPPGEFDMGSEEPVEELTEAFAGSGPELFANEVPAHRVRITRPLYFAKHEVTVAQFRAFVTAREYMTDAERDGQGGWGWNAEDGKSQRGKQFTWKSTGFPQTDSHPVVNVTWNDAKAFVDWLSSQDPSGECRLPTEAEWEYACRAGTTTRWFTGNADADLVRVANLGDEALRAMTKDNPSRSLLEASDGAAFTAAVGSYEANPFGLCDMHGNVWEMCQDWYVDRPLSSSSMAIDPAGPGVGTQKTVRGGSWLGAPEAVRSAKRIGSTPAYATNARGFRVVIVPKLPY